MNQVNHEKVRISKYINQAGFTKGCSIQTHIDRLWKLIADAKKKRTALAVASLDIRAAYDGVNH